MNNPRAKLALAFFASIVAATACVSTAPLSFVEGIPSTKTDPTLYPVRLVAIDSHMEFNRPDAPAMISPGLHQLVLEASPSEGVHRHIQKTYSVAIAPCTHYFFAAKRNSPMEADWTLVVDRKEPVSGCDPKEELKKAGNTQ
jgi:hypothetical protein